MLRHAVIATPLRARRRSIGITDAAAADFSLRFVSAVVLHTVITEATPLAV